MTQLHLDFLNPGRRRSRAGIVVFALGALLAALTLWHHARLASEVDGLRERVRSDSSMVRRDRAPLRLADGPRSPAQAQAVAAANAVLASLNRPWSALFAELESTASAEVALLSIKPQSDGRGVLIGGEARRYEQMLNYAARLEATRGFANVFFVSHFQREGADGSAFGFLLNADWVAEP